MSSQPGTLSYLDRSRLAGPLLAFLVVQGMVGAEETDSRSDPDMILNSDGGIVQHDATVIDEGMITNTDVAANLTPEVWIDDQIPSHRAQKGMQDLLALFHLVCLCLVISYEEVLCPSSTLLDIRMGVLVDLARDHELPLFPAGRTHLNPHIGTHYIPLICFLFSGR